MPLVSTLPSAESVRLVRSAVQVARAGVSVEAELGHVRFGEGDCVEAGLTARSSTWRYCRAANVLDGVA